jgi:hypothetical protein
MSRSRSSVDSRSAWACAGNTPNVATQKLTPGARTTRRPGQSGCSFGRTSGQDYELSVGGRRIRCRPEFARDAEFEARMSKFRLPGLTSIDRYTSVTRVSCAGTLNVTRVRKEHAAVMEKSAYRRSSISSPGRSRSSYRMTRQIDGSTTSVRRRTGIDQRIETAAVRTSSSRRPGLRNDQTDKALETRRRHRSEWEALPAVSTSPYVTDCGEGRRRKSCPASRARAGLRIRTDQRR